MVNGETWSTKKLLVTSECKWINCFNQFYTIKRIRTILYKMQPQSDNSHNNPGTVDELWNGVQNMNGWHKGFRIHILFLDDSCDDFSVRPLVEVQGDSTPKTIGRCSLLLKLLPETVWGYVFTEACAIAMLQIIVTPKSLTNSKSTGKRPNCGAPL